MKAPKVKKAVVGRKGSVARRQAATALNLHSPMGLGFSV